MPAQTVTGPLDVAELGFTLMHEHVHTCSSVVRLHYPQEFDRERALDEAVRRLSEARAMGVRTVVEPTTCDLGRDVAFVAEASRRSGVNVISATGLYLQVDEYFHRVGLDHTVGMMLHDIERGVADTGIRVGMIKCAIDKALDRNSELSLRVGGRLQKLTGLPVTVHTSAKDRSGEIACRILEEEGAEPARVVLGHSGDSVDLDYLRGLARRGYVLGMDRFGLDHLLDIPARIRTIVTLCQEGFADRMIISHDCSCWKDWFTDEIRQRISPNWRMTLVPEVVIPGLREAGVSQAEVDTMMIHNPARLLDIPLR